MIAIVTSNGGWNSHWEFNELKHLKDVPQIGNLIAIEDLRFDKVLVDSSVMKNPYIAERIQSIKDVARQFDCNGHKHTIGMIDGIVNNDIIVCFDCHYYLKISGILSPNGNGLLTAKTIIKLGTEYIDPEKGLIEDIPEDDYIEIPLDIYDRLTYLSIKSDLKAEDLLNDISNKKTNFTAVMKLMDELGIPRTKPIKR